MRLDRLLNGALAGALVFGAGSATAETTLRITLQLPMKSHIGQNLLRFEELVEGKSAGEIQVEIYDSAQLYKDAEVPQAVGEGQIEMGTASLTRYVGEVPAVDVFYLPFLFNSEELVRKATAPDSPVRQPLDAAILETGSRVLWWQAYGGAILLSNGEPVRTPADLEGKKVRVFGKTLGTWIESLGGAPTLISGSEQYLAYQRGTVDIGMTGVSGVRSRSLWEVMDTITVTNNADVEFVVLINEDVWQGLSEEERAIIDEAARDAEVAVRDAMSAIEAEAYGEAEANGMTVYHPSADEIEQWKASADAVIEQYLERSGELGAEVLEAARNL